MRELYSEIRLNSDINHSESTELLDKLGNCDVKRIVNELCNIKLSLIGASKDLQRIFYTPLVHLKLNVTSSLNS